MGVVGVVVSVVASLVAVSLASANPALVAGFEVDAKIQRQASTGEDWADGPGGQGVIDDSGSTRAAICAANTNTNPLLVCDDVKSDNTTFPGGAKESDPSGWVPLQAGQVTPKTDITNVYAYGKPNSGNPTLLNGMERLPKAGDLHLDFEYNKVMTGTGANQVPQRQANDILVAYDLGGGRQSNGDAITVRVYKAKKIDPTCTSDCAGAYDYANPDTSVAGTGTVSGNGVTAQLNGDTIECGPWQCYDDGGNLTTTLPAFSFAEAGIDLNTSVGLSSACFNFVTVKSRSSESVTSQLKDTTGPKSFPFCGGLAVHKFIDANNNGVKNIGEADGSNWSFTVNGPAAGGSIGPLVCSGTTNSSGNLVCSGSGQSLTDLTPGTYRVTETQKTGFYNTNPGDTTAGATYPLVNKGATVSKDVTIGIGGTTTVEFGNSCLTDVTFNINNVPASGVSSVTVAYSATGPSAVSNQTLALTINSTTHVASGTINDAFTPSDSITWSWYINGDSAHSLSGTSTALSGCSTTQSASFTLTTLNGYKYKDVNHDGDFNAGDIDGAGFTFDLKSGSTVVATTTSATDGTYSFSNVAPGSYTVVERAVTGWVQTEPSSGGRSVTVNLGDATKQIGDFGNTPKSDISMSFSNQAVNPGTTTPATAGTITCKDASDTAVGGPQSGNTYAANGLYVGTYTCTVVIVDP